MTFSTSVIKALPAFQTLMQNILSNIEKTELITPEKGLLSKFECKNLIDVLELKTLVDLVRVTFKEEKITGQKSVILVKALVNNELKDLDINIEFNSSYSVTLGAEVQSNQKNQLNSFPPLFIKTIVTFGPSHHVGKTKVKGISIRPIQDKVAYRLYDAELSYENQIVDIISEEKESYEIWYNLRHRPMLVNSLVWRYLPKREDAKKGDYGQEKHVGYETIFDDVNNVIKIKIKLESSQTSLNFGE
jgi:hypothetical protein